MKITRGQLRLIIQESMRQSMKQRGKALQQMSMQQQPGFDANEDGVVNYDELERIIRSVGGDLKDMDAPQLELLSRIIDKLVAQL
jgi:hypothetical protein